MLRWLKRLWEFHGIRFQLHPGVWNNENNLVFRVYQGFLYRNCIFDWTRVDMGARGMAVHVTMFRWTIKKKNWHAFEPPRRAD